MNSNSAFNIDLDLFFTDFATDVVLTHQGVTRVVKAIVDHYYAEYDADTPIASSKYLAQVKTLDVADYDVGSLVIYNGDSYTVNAKREDTSGITELLLGVTYDDY